jgi:hypothetical protein
MRTEPVRIRSYGVPMHNSGLEELARHRQRELLDTATYIRNARRAQRRTRRTATARGLGQGIAGWFARLVRPSRRQPQVVVPVPPRPSRVLQAGAVGGGNADTSAAGSSMDDDFLVAC